MKEARQYCLLFCYIISLVIEVTGRTNSRSRGRLDNAGLVVFIYVLVVLRTYVRTYSRRFEVLCSVLPVHGIGLFSCFLCDVMKCW